MGDKNPKKTKKAKKIIEKVNASQPAAATVISTVKKPKK